MKIIGTKHNTEIMGSKNYSNHSKTYSNYIQKYYIIQSIFHHNLTLQNSIKNFPKCILFLCLLSSLGNAIR